MDYEKEISFGAFDSELMYQEIFIPEGFEATIVGDKIILKKTESDDEKIRKTLLSSFEYRIRESYPDKEWICGVKLKEIVAWLEKQKSVGEIVERCKNSWYNEGKIAGQFEGITDDEKYQQGWHDALEKQCKESSWKPSKEQINALEHFVRSIGESGYASPYDNNLNRIKSLLNDLCKLEKQGEQKVPSVEFKAKDWYVSNVDGKIHDMTYHRVQPKQEWSEDDERIVTALMEGFRYHQLFNPRFGEVPNAEIISWIKSLKERLS